jgi:hypothetical protein
MKFHGKGDAQMQQPPLLAGASNFTELIHTTYLRSTTS